MSSTQKMYLGDHEIGITRFGEHGNIINGGFPYFLDIDYLLVGGGGGGGGNDAGGGGGGGGGAQYGTESVTGLGAAGGNGEVKYRFLRVN